MASNSELKTPGYHLREIKRGEIGEISKIREELEELEDADEQGVRLMVLQELADMVGAIDQYLHKHHPGFGMSDLLDMALVTGRAFKNGHRASKEAPKPQLLTEEKYERPHAWNFSDEDPISCAVCGVSRVGCNKPCRRKQP